MIARPAVIRVRPCIRVSVTRHNQTVLTRAVRGRRNVTAIKKTNEEETTAISRLLSNELTEFYNGEFHHESNQHRINF